MTIVISITVTILLYDNFGNNIENKNSEKQSNSISNKTLTNIHVNIFKSRYVTVYSLANRTGPNGILVDREGIVWTSGSSSHSLFRLDSRNNTLRSYDIPLERHGDTMVWTMVQDNDGFIWFSQFGGKPLWMFDPTSKKFSLFHTSAPPFQMKLDKKTGNIWFTTLVGNTLGIIQKVENKTESWYKITEFPTGQDTDPSGLYIKDGSIWVAELGEGKIIKFDAIRNTDGFVNKITKMLVIPPGKNLFSSPTDVLVQNNETVWVTEHTSSTISEYDLKSNTWKRFSTAQTVDQIPTLPFWMRESLDHKGLWFNEHQGNRLAFFNTTDHTLTEFDIPNNQPPEPSPYMINNPVARQNIAAQDAYYSAVFTLNLSLDPKNPNRLWFSQWNNDKIGVVDRSRPIPFDIHSNVTRVVLSGNDSAQQKAIIGLDVTPNHNVLSEENNSTNSVFLTTSSTMVPNGGFMKVSAKFTNDVINFTKPNMPVQLVLKNEDAKPGNYTMGISVSDGLVTKTIFLDLDILQ